MVFKKITQYIFIFSISFYSYAADSKLVKKDYDQLQMNEISSEYRWDKVKNLSLDLKQALILSDEQDNLEILQARFIFKIEGNYKDYNPTFFKREYILKNLSGMDFTSIGENIFAVEDTVLGYRVTAHSTLSYELDYYLFQGPFEYIALESESNLVHLSTKNFSKGLNRADIVVHTTQDGNYVKVIVDSFAVLSKDVSNKFTARIVKPFIVSQMLSQIKKSPQVYQTNPINRE